MAKEKDNKTPKVGRRDFLKVSGAAALAVGAVSAAVVGYDNGSDRSTYTGYENAFGERFDRTPFEIDTPVSFKLPTGSRNSVFCWPQTRRSDFATHINLPEGLSLMNYLHSVGGASDPRSIPMSIVTDPDLRDFYNARKAEDGWDWFAEDMHFILEVMPRWRRIVEEAKFDMTLLDAYILSQHMYAPYHLTKVSQTSDFEGVAKTKLEGKDPKEMSRMVKKIGHMFGSPIVRIAKIQPEWMYDRYPVAVNGAKRLDPIKYQPHWKYGIVMGMPLSWDLLGGNPNFGSSSEAYGPSSVLAFKMANFVRHLGYPAREQCPNRHYEFAMGPVMMASGVGERGRNGLVITPELGANFRPCMVLTDLPLEPDRPIDIGIKRFCESCKICAESCPTRSISFDSAKDITGTGLMGWKINSGTCHHFWNSVPNSNQGCRVCQASCPFSQKSNWLHTTARDVTIRDKTGITGSMLASMEKAFYKPHPGSYYHYKDGSREYSVVKEIPWFLKTGDFFKEPK